MKRSLFLICTILLLGSCFSDKNVDPATPSTFIRYFSDGYNNTAVSLEETSDKGFILLANSTVQNTDADAPKYNIELVKTDPYGNVVWKKYYPEVFTGSEPTGFIGHSLTLLPNDAGYLIVGRKIEVVNQATLSKFLILVVDQNGMEVKSRVFDSSYSIIGQTAAVMDNGNYLVMASNPISKSILVAELNTATTTLDSVWSKQYGQGTVNLCNRLYYTGGTIPYFFWGGDNTQNGSSADLFVNKSPLNNSSTLNGLGVIGTSANNEYALDFCQRGAEFCFTGYSSKNGGDIIYYRVSDQGILRDSATYTNDIFDPKKLPQGGNTQKEVGNSITATKDGGLIILGTIETYTGSLGRGDTDMILLKIDPLGKKQWAKTIGSLDADGGNCIRQTSDGGYIVAGTTRLAALRTVMLVKTDKNGDVD